nr:uncharacterized protein LOC109160960 [Ipomoea batatas]
MGSLNVVKSLPNKLADRNTTNGSSKASFGIEASTNSAQEVRVAMPSNYPQSNEEAMTSSPTAPAMLLSGMVFTAGATYPVLYNSSMIFGLNKNSHHLMTTFSSNESGFTIRIVIFVCELHDDAGEIGSTLCGDHCKWPNLHRLPSVLLVHLQCHSSFVGCGADG